MAITQNGVLKRDDNESPVMGGTSSSDNATIINSAFDPLTRRLLTDSAGGGTGTVTQIDTTLPISGGPITTTGTITTSMATNKLIGRGTGGTGVMEEITLGTNLSLSGTTLNAASGLTTLTIGTTTITSGTTTRILYDNAGVLGEYTISGSGTVVAMQTSPQLITPNIGVATGTSLDVSGVLESGTNTGTGGQLKMFGSTSGDVTLKVAAAAGTATVFQLPATNGTNTYVLQTNGSGITSWVPQSGGGGTPGTPVNSIQYNNAGSFAGSATLLFNGTNTITYGEEGNSFFISGVDATTTDTDGATLNIEAGDSNGTANGGTVSINGGAGGATGDGGSVALQSGSGGATSGAGGAAFINAGSASGTNSNGGAVFLQPGAKTGAGTAGKVQITDPASNLHAILNTASIASTDKTYTFPNASGTFALTTGGALALVVGTTTIGSGTTTRILYDNSGVLGEYTITGTGTVVAMQTSPSLLTSLLMDSGFVMNWASSNVVLTHSSGILTLGTGELRITTPGTNAASVPTLGSTSTLTNKTLTSPVINTPTLGGAQQLLEGASIRLDPVLSADGTYTGTTITGTAGTTLAFGDLIYLAVADSRWELADASAVSTGAQLTGFCVLAAASDGDPTVILLNGNIRADTAFPTLTVGAPVFMSETSGDITNTAPTTTDSVTRVLGWGVDGNSMIVSVSPDWVTHT